MIVEFIEEATETSFDKIAEEGILVCLRRYRFFGNFVSNALDLKVVFFFKK